MGNVVSHALDVCLWTVSHRLKAEVIIIKCMRRALSTTAEANREKKCTAGKVGSYRRLCVQKNIGQHLHTAQAN